MATVAVVLKTTKKLSNNEYAVAIRATHERQSRYYPLSTLVTNQSLPWRCTTADWKPAEAEDNGLGKFRKTFLPYKECNSILKTKLTEAQLILTRYEEQNIMFSFEQFEADLKHKEYATTPVTVVAEAVQSVSLQDYYSQQILILEEQQREGMAGLYRENKSILNKFKPSAMLIDVNFRFLESFEYWMRNVRNNMDTTISVKMRNLQRVINQAIEDKLFNKDEYPFGEKRYSINKRLDHNTKKIAIMLDRVSKIKALDLKPGSSLHFAQQVFLFSYYCRGMNFVDMTFLKWKDIVDNTLTYTRRKTRGKFNIPLNSHALTILKFFKQQYEIPGGYVFPILNPKIHTTTKQQYTRKKTALKAVNDNLKKLANLIDEPSLKLTTNVGRHTYATGLKRSGANTAYITEALGHATQEQTQTYLAEFEKGEIESWENKMFEV
ncbi:site-specific integrase [Mucilaginibacter boryungensis]|uniref:Site-specific integrase n=1 Tax=Mucilaginibacter boryungensis TaxID=768480 RepID=A0ABR9XNV9_9SPHI|nr:site-specific integrase [Mucilaginibacter boryungensis]MBE9668713.1 site-specific integrase [Mucilaginibacter boryungensis]